MQSDPITSGDGLPPPTQALFCQVPPSHVLNMHDVSNIWHVPLIMQEQDAHVNICKHLQLPGAENLDLKAWRTQLAERWDNLKETVTIAMVGKYTELSDAYLSVLKVWEVLSVHDVVVVGCCCTCWRCVVGCCVFHIVIPMHTSSSPCIPPITPLSLHVLHSPRCPRVHTQALLHATVAYNRRLNLLWVEASDLEADTKTTNEAQYTSAWDNIRAAQGILVPGGFGSRGVEGKILAAEYARTHRTPYLGICLGMQIAVIEFARNVLGWADANSTEFDATTTHPVVIFMPEGSKTHKGGTMRLGARRTILQTVDCHSARLYQTEKHIDERHRHRYEVNPELVPLLEAKGLRFVGRDETGERMEILEHADHPFFVAAQFHPEFKSRPFTPSPLFLGFIMASSSARGEGGAVPNGVPVKAG